MEAEAVGKGGKAEQRVEKEAERGESKDGESQSQSSAVGETKDREKKVSTADTGEGKRAMPKRVRKVAYYKVFYVKSGNKLTSRDPRVLGVDLTTQCWMSRKGKHGRLDARGGGTERRASSLRPYHDVFSEAVWKEAGAGSRSSEKRYENGKTTCAVKYPTMPTVSLEVNNLTKKIAFASLAERDDFVRLITDGPNILKDANAVDASIGLIQKRQRAAAELETKAETETKAAQDAGSSASAAERLLDPNTESPRRSSGGESKSASKGEASGDDPNDAEATFNAFRNAKNEEGEDIEDRYVCACVPVCLCLCVCVLYGVETFEHAQTGLYGQERVCE